MKVKLFIFGITIIMVVSHFVIGQKQVEPIILKGNIGTKPHTQYKENIKLYDWQPIDDYTREQIENLFDFGDLRLGNIQIYQSSLIPAAHVGIKSNIECLIVNPDLMTKVAKNHWETMAILAHEAGHLINGDLSLPKITKKEELIADEFAGYFCKKYKCADVQTILSVFKQFGSDSTHHPYLVREAAIKRGWKQAKKTKFTYPINRGPFSYFRRKKSAK